MHPTNAILGAQRMVVWLAGFVLAGALIYHAAKVGIARAEAQAHIYAQCGENKGDE